jgi:hypothetical protein
MQLAVNNLSTTASCIVVVNAYSRVLSSKQRVVYHFIARWISIAPTIASRRQSFTYADES